MSRRSFPASEGAGGASRWTLSFRSRRHMALGVATLFVVAAVVFAIAGPLAVNGPPSGAFRESGLPSTIKVTEQPYSLRAQPSASLGYIAANPSGLAPFLPVLGRSSIRTEEKHIATSRGFRAGVLAVALNTPGPAESSSSSGPAPARCGKGRTRAWTSPIAISPAPI